ncbi:MAG: phytanoyl-CoA dioxygenase PhyH [Verrucomicrobiaceae bacterium]|nr:phytanoyl-CoA dioxygenase PhyH [Verrucomicrobiaceae bacterium]
MTSEPTTLVESTACGRLGVMHLKRYWSKCLLRATGKLPQEVLREEGKIDTTLIAVVGLGLHQALTHLYHNKPSFDAFEDWLSSLHPEGLNQAKIDEFNAYILSRRLKQSPPDPATHVLSEEDMAFWEENGYVIIRQAVSRTDCEAAISAICEFIEIDRSESTSWYRPHPSRVGIMVQLFQHPALEKNRQSAKVRAAYRQLWNRTDLWLNTDRAGFNPPETSSWKFPGPRLHWDVSLAQPIPFGSQGILYLADTEANQGAFTLVPGFQNRVAGWLSDLPPGADPRDQDLYALGTRPIVANAGDFIIWHHALPHGSSPNTSSLPRFVQYINYEPLDAEVHEEWI